MKQFLVLAVLIAGAAAAPLLDDVDSPSGNDVYNVVFKRNVTAATRDEHYAVLKHWIARSYTNSAIRQFINIGRLVGYNAVLEAGLLHVVRSMEEVEYVEREMVFRKYQSGGSCAAEKNVIWNLDRLSDREPDYTTLQFSFPGERGQGVDVYVVDTGVYVQHDEFAGRAVWGANFADDLDEDCDGHGTHVAGTIAGTKFGVAKHASIIAVKVLGCDGTGTNTGVANGIGWATSQHRTNKQPSVINLSLGGGHSQLIIDAVHEAIDEGVHVVVAAGNEDADACNSSPANAPRVLTIGATSEGPAGSSDVRSWFSNFGSCLDLFAPGDLIKAAWIGGRAETNTISGTSMASPHVAGAAALLLGTDQYRSATPAQLQEKLVADGTRSLIKFECVRQRSRCEASPNVMLHVAC